MGQSIYCMEKDCSFPFYRDTKIKILESDDCQYQVPSVSITNILKGFTGLVRNTC
jgi:hypothetical protein